MTHTGLDDLTEQTFHPARTRRIAEKACRLAGLDGTGAVLLRHQTNAVYQLTTVPVVVKVARPGTGHVTNVVSLVQWLTEQAIPTVPLATTIEQPLELAGCAVTLWRYLPQRRPIAAGDIAGPLAALHHVPPPPVPVPPLEPVTAIRRGIASSRILNDAERAVLCRRCDELADAMVGIDYHLKPTLIHGDAQHRNTLWDDANHRPVLCDWESAAIGQPEWDLATIEIHCRRFGHAPREYDDFCQRYGFDIRDWPGYPLLRDLRELRMITTNARKSTAGSPQAAEVHRRIAVLGDKPTERWVIL
jgi:hypothetical protein